MIKLIIIILLVIGLFIYIPSSYRTEVIRVAEKIVYDIKSHFSDAFEEVYTPDDALRKEDNMYDEVSKLLEQTRKLREKFEQK